jgi:hypothetical protein
MLDGRCLRGRTSEGMHMMRDDLDEKFEAYLARDDDALVGSRFYEILTEIEQRRPQETVEVTLRVIDGQAHFEPSESVRTFGNELWIGDKRVVVKVAD